MSIDLRKNYTKHEKEVAKRCHELAKERGFTFADHSNSLYYRFSFTTPEGTMFPHSWHNKFSHWEKRTTDTSRISFVWWNVQRILSEEVVPWKPLPHQNT